MDLLEKGIRIDFVCGLRAGEDRKRRDQVKEKEQRKRVLEKNTRIGGLLVANVGM